MSPALKALLLAGSFPLCFQACDTASPAAPQPVPPLLQCRGTPGYSESWPEILHGLDTSGVVYCAPPRTDEISSRTWTGNDVSGDSLDPLRIHQVVLDAQCRFLEDRNDTLTIPSRTTGFSGIMMWGGRLQDGSAAPTGEYFVNTVREWPDGRKDTTWEKTGYIRTACP